MIAEVTVVVPEAMEKENIFGEKLLNSSLNGDMEEVMAALAQGGKVTWRNHQGLTPFLAAAQNGHKDICNLLLALGSDVNETSPGSQKTALLQASLGGHKASVEALLSWGAAVGLRDSEGFTPFLAAAANGHTDICGLLLAAGSSVDEQVTDTKKTALHLATDKGHKATVEALHSWGAVDSRNDHGFSPLVAAAHDGHADVCGLLAAHCNNTNEVLSWVPNKIY